MKNPNKRRFFENTIFVLLLATVMTLFFASCSGEKANNDKNDKNHEKILASIDLIEDAWWERYEKSGVVDKKDWYLEIKNTRYIKLSDHNVKTLENVDAVIEFDLYTNFYGTKPYYENGVPPDCVVIYTDGTMEVRDYAVMRAYRATTYDTEFANFIEYVKDYNGKYNCVMTYEDK